MNYYFLAASLPMVSMDEPPAIKLPEFLSRCESELSKRDYVALDAVIHGRDCSHPFGVEWRDRDWQIRNALVRARAAKQGREPAALLKEHGGFDAHGEATVQDLASRDNPLETEMALDRLRWSILDELGGANMFSLSAIMAYGLKLRLAERWAAMDEKEGRDKLDEIVSEQMASIHF